MYNLGRKSYCSFYEEDTMKVKCTWCNQVVSSEDWESHSQSHTLHGPGCTEVVPARIYWLSRHDLSPAQMSAIRDLHGEDAEVVKDPVVFSNTDGLADYIRSHADGFVYAVAGAPHYIAAALVGLRFGVFENHPQKRQDGSFGLAAVYHVDVEIVHHDGRVCDYLPLTRASIRGSLKKVWVNPDPMSDRGEALIPVAR